MAEPVIDSLSGGGAGAIPPTGPGSQTPPVPGKGAGGGAPIGGGPDITPQGMPGAPMKAPQTPEEQAAEQLDIRSLDSLADSVNEFLEGASVSAADKSKRIKTAEDKIENVLNKLLEAGFTEARLNELRHKMRMKPREFFETIFKKLQSAGVVDTKKFLKDKLLQKDELPIKTAPPITPQQGSPTSAGSPTATPDAGMLPFTKANLTDVNLNNIFNNREAMGMTVKIKEGALIEVPDTNKSAEVLNKLVLSIRNAKRAISSFEDEKLKFAGRVVLKRAAEEVEEDLDEETDPGAEPEGLDLEESDDMGEEDLDKEKLMAGLDLIKDGVSELEAAMGGVEEEIGGEGEMGPEDLGQAEGLMGMATATVSKGKEILKSAKREITALCGKDKKKGKGKGKKDSKDAMSVAMGGKSAAFNFEKKDDKDEKKKDEKDEKKKDEKDEKKDEKKDDKKKESNENYDTLIDKVRAKLAELREPKEANLYPFDVEPYKIPPVDNTNAQTATSQASAINGEWPGAAKASGDRAETIVPAFAEPTLPTKTEGKSTTGKGVSGVEAKMKKDAMDLTASKAKLSVELAARQQLKGLLSNPLKEAMVKNMIEAGIAEDVAKDITHNAFVDGYEESQKIILKEAFETFMEKSYDDFVKVADFTDKYITKEGTEFAPVEGGDREKSASINSVPLRGSSADTDRNPLYKEYWQQQGRARRGF